MALSEADARARAEAEVQAYCGWHIAPSRRETLVVDGSGARVQPLPTMRLTELHSLTVDDQAVDVNSVEWSQSGWLRSDTAQTSRLRGVSVDITHGFDDWPLDVLNVIDRMTTRAVELSESSQVLSQVGQVRYAVGVEGLRNVGLLSDVDRIVLDRYRPPTRV